jgi:5S rRNA maturation endonuclease (ribonuclease M5)
MEKIQLLIEKLAADSAKGCLIIVEGQKDFKALRQSGISGKILTAKTSRKSFLDLIAEIEKQSYPQVILLLDFDRRGKELTKRLVRHLETVRIKTNADYWKELHALIGRDVKDIEGIPKYLETLNQKLTQAIVKLNPVFS